MGAWRYPFALLGIVFVLIGYAFWPKHTRIPVLIYHDIASSTQMSDSYTVERTLLARELEYLKEHGYTTLSFTSAETLTAQGLLPKYPVIISFDDALPGQTLAREELHTRGMAATFFIPSDLVGDAAHLNWSDVRAIAAAGMEIGGHGATHAHVSKLSGDALEHEIVADKQRIEAELGKQITVFAYPFEEKSDDAASLVARAGYTIVRDSSPYQSSVLTNSFEVFLKAL